jgi:hypothetical protein
MKSISKISQRALLCAALLFSVNCYAAARGKHSSSSSSDSSCCNCAPEVKCLLKKQPYKDEFSVLTHENLIKIGQDVLNLLSNPTEANYQQVLADAHQVVLDMNAKNPTLYPFVPALNPANTNYQSPRVVIAESDGNVIVDTGKNSGSFSATDPLLAFLTAVPALDTNAFAGSASGNKVTTGNAGNSLVNWQNRDVNENHNSRNAIANAQRFPCGVGLETKFSSSVLANQAGVAIRLGQLDNNNGTIRVTVNTP